MKNGIVRRLFSSFLFVLFAALFFESCGGGNSGSTHLSTTLTGGESNEWYEVSYNYYDLSFFTKGFIDSRGRIFSNKQNIPNVVAEFQIISRSFSLEIYEGQTLPNGFLFYVYAGKINSKQTERRRIGELYLTSRDGNTELNYMEYDLSLSQK